MSDGKTPQQRRKRRRALLRHAALTRMPLWLSRGRLNRLRPGNHFQINGRTIEFDGLPDELCGLKIAHLSDPHVGSLVTPDHLGEIVEAANRLEADLIVGTGDFVDLSNDYLPAVVEAMERLSAPLGVYFVLGNHDYLDDGAAVARAFEAAGLNLLMNRSVRVEHQMRTIGVGGIDWAKKDAELRRMVHMAAQGMREVDFRILLAHHPHAFDAACECGIHLTLAGHTHGGQVLLSTRRSKKGSIGLASLTNRYPRGLYSRGDSRLFVSSGVGSWFPLRFRCPAEMTLLELQNRY